MNAIAAIRLFADKKQPSERQLAARHANALRIADKIEHMIAQGYRVHDHVGDVVEKVDKRPGGDIIFVMREGGNIIQFMKDPTFDNGAMDSISDFNASFAGWTFIDPRDIKPLKV